MGGRWLVAGFVAGLAACAGAPPPPPEPPLTAGQLLTRTSCPFRIASADAWVNYMPGPARGPRLLHVAVRLQNPTDTAVLLKADVSVPGELTLEVRGAPASAIPGHLSYSEPAPDPMPGRVVLLCRGGELHAITSIERVY